MHDLPPLTEEELAAILAVPLEYMPGGHKGFEQRRTARKHSLEGLHAADYFCTTQFEGETE